MAIKAKPSTAFKLMAFALHWNKVSNIDMIYILTVSFYLMVFPAFESQEKHKIF